jgi:glycosyltransferase involved in cell wall biosynthesis
MVSHHYFDELSSARRVNEIVSTRRNSTVGNLAKADKDPIRNVSEQPFDYLLIVSTVEPRKNHTTLLAAWEQLRTEHYPKLKLVVVGMLGWDHEPIVKKFLPWVERGELYVLEDVPSPELRLLYKHARATVCPSFGEGFDFSGVEAMRSGGAVVASDIAVHREIYAKAAEFFNPYSIGELVKAIVAVVDPLQGERRKWLVEEGGVVSRRYLPDIILPKWQEFLGALHTKRFQN